MQGKVPVAGAPTGVECEMRVEIAGIASRCIKILTGKFRRRSGNVLASIRQDLLPPHVGRDWVWLWGIEVRKERLSHERTMAQHAVANKAGSGLEVTISRTG